MPNAEKTEKIEALKGRIQGSDALLLASTEVSPSTTPPSSAAPSWPGALLCDEEHTASAGGQRGRDRGTR